MPSIDSDRMPHALIDSHAHLTMREFDAGRANQIRHILNADRVKHVRDATAANY